jgi:hypothetical protein
VSTLREFLAAIAFTIALALGGHHYWLGQYGANFNPDVALDVSQVIDRMPHGLFTL